MPTHGETAAFEYISSIWVGGEDDDGKVELVVITDHLVRRLLSFTAKVDDEVGTVQIEVAQKFEIDDLALALLLVVRCMQVNYVKAELGELPVVTFTLDDFVDD